MTRFEWINAVLSASGPSSPTVRLVLCALGRHMNDDGACWPSVGRLAECSALSERAVQGALAEAEAGRWLVREAKAGRVTRYLLATPAAGAPPQQVHPPPQDLHPAPAPPAPTPAAGAPELFKEGRKKERTKEGLPCPFCSAPMEKKKPRNGAPVFWGCSAFKVTGCKGKLEVDERPGAGSSSQQTRELLAEIRAQRELARRDPSPSLLVGATLREMLSSPKRGDRLQPANPRTA